MSDKAGSKMTDERMCRLDECPEGLFIFNGILGFKSEYAGDIFVVASGEMFWGGTEKKADRAALMVTPIAYEDAERILASRTPDVEKAAEAARKANRQPGATWEAIVTAAAPFLQGASGQGDAQDVKEALAALQWKPITEQNLPKIGDEVLAARGIVDTVTNPARATDWAAWSYTHFRPINAPAR